MGATLAGGGINPATGERVVSPDTSRDTLSILASNGLYEHSGEWLLEIGLPARSGVSGGIVAVAPGKGALGVFSPPLDEAGNSVRGKAAAGHLSRMLGLDLFASGVPLSEESQRSLPDRVLDVASVGLDAPAVVHHCGSLALK